jgi:hypothetical protein
MADIDRTTHLAQVLGHPLGLLLCSSNSFLGVWASENRSDGAR